MSTAVAAVCFIGVVFCLIVLVRNERVYRFTGALSALIHPGREDFDLLFAELRSVSYDAMVWQFWRPLENFYRGTLLLERYRQAQEPKE